MAYLSPQLKLLKLLIFQFLQPSSIWTQQYALCAHPCGCTTLAPQQLLLLPPPCLRRRLLLFTFNSCKKYLASKFLKIHL